MKRLKWFVIGGLAVVLVIVVVAAILVYLQLNKDTIKLGNTNSELAFISDRDGDWDIYLLSPDGTLKNLTEDSDGHEYFMNFTFDGKAVAFYSSHSGEVTPAVVQVDGSGFKTMSWMEAFASMLAEGRTDNDPAWSPDSTQIVWSKLRGFGVDLYLANADGSEEKSLVDKGPTDSAPAWSSDGQHLVFTADKSDQQNVYVLDIASGEATALTKDYWDFQPAWSMDGKSILFARDVDDALPQGTIPLYIMNADGSELRAFEEGDSFKGDPTYSPDGSQVVYMSNEDGKWHIYLMDADGSNVRRLTEGDSNNLFPAWRPIPADESASAAGS
jgi:TolB protein